jgi:hypothetical protein
MTIEENPFKPATIGGGIAGQVSSMANPAPQKAEAKPEIKAAPPVVQKQEAPPEKKVDNKSKPVQNIVVNQNLIEQGLEKFKTFVLPSSGKSVVYDTIKMFYPKIKENIDKGHTYKSVIVAYELDKTFPNITPETLARYMRKIGADKKKRGAK